MYMLAVIYVDMDDSMDMGDLLLFADSDNPGRFCKSYVTPYDIFYRLYITSYCYASFTPYGTSADTTTDTLPDALP